MSASERHAGDRFGVVDAGGGRDDYPGRVAVVGGEIGVVDAQREQRAGVHDLRGRQDGVPEGAAALQRLDQEPGWPVCACEPGEIAQPYPGPRTGDPVAGRGMAYGDVVHHVFGAGPCAPGKLSRWCATVSFTEPSRSLLTSRNPAVAAGKCGSPPRCCAYVPGIWRLADVILTFPAGMAVLPLTGSAACPVFRVRVGVAGPWAVEGACRAAGPAP